MIRRLIARTYAKWSRDDGWIYAGAMAAFAALALAPLLVVTLRLAETYGDERIVIHGLARIVDPFVGHGAVRAIDGVVRADKSSPNAGVETALAVVIALFSGSRLFYALQRALHVMWKTEARQGATLVGAVGSFAIAAILSVVVIAGMTVIVFGSAALAGVGHAAGVRGVAGNVAMRAGIAALGAVVLAPIVALLFRYLPGTGLRWSDVWPGALATAVGFAFGQFAIGAYLASVDLPWTYGSAAAIVVSLLWLYYSSYLFLVGAEFTVVYARERGSPEAPA